MGRQEGKLCPGRGIDGLLGRRWLSLTQSAGKLWGPEIGGKKQKEASPTLNLFRLFRPFSLTCLPPSLYFPRRGVVLNDKAKLPPLK